MSDLSDPVYYEIVAAKVQMLFKKPFLGNLASGLITVDASSWCETAATDGRHLFYNREFIKKLSKAELFFLIAHEIYHCVYDHIGRRGSRDPKLWNMANDYIVNYTLVKEKCGDMPASGLYDEQFTDEMTSEEVYEILKKNSVTIKMPLDHHLDAVGEGEGGEGGQNGQGDGDGFSVTITGKDGPPKLTEEDVAKIRAKVKADILRAAAAVGAGNIPAGIRRMIEDLTTPKMDWRALLDTHFRSALKDDYTFQRMARQTWAMQSLGGFIMPAQDYMDTISVDIAIDCSGSMTDDMLRDFLSEVRGIMDTFKDFKIGLWVFDTKVYNYTQFTAENIHEIVDYPMAGGGGTMFECNWEFMKQNGIEPDRFVMFTDGYPNSGWGDPNYCDTLFVIYGDEHQKITAPFGVTAHYEPKKLAKAA